MTKKKPKIKPKKFGYTGPKKTYIVDAEKGIIPIEEWPNPGFGIVKKPTLHAKGGLAGIRRFNKGGKVK
jgi:hypothetical protein|tara:strand:- start:378 stop:584 length:207 start_codon:yes stop_codon:yes gene_type:complete